ncbi:hypothetical protein E4U14_004599 [Claviceps sp. LM454 group G7]|nr:hypothetical protein E4U14_004599 [Claviceps sp. LM454 group G7]
MPFRLPDEERMVRARDVKFDESDSPAPLPSAENIHTWRSMISYPSASSHWSYRFYGQSNEGGRYKGLLRGLRQDLFLRRLNGVDRLPGEAEEASGSSSPRRCAKPRVGQP